MLMQVDIIKKIKSTSIYETLKHSKNYFSADIATKAISLISIPIFTRLFTQADYGIVAVFGSYVGIMIVILSLNSYTSVGRYYFEKEGNFNEFVGTTLIFTGLIFCSACFLYFIFYKQIVNLIELPGLLPVFLLVASLFSIVYSIYYQILVAQKKSKETAIISVSQSYIELGVAIVIVYLLKNDRYLGRIWATLSVGLIFSIYFLIKIFYVAKFRFDSKYIKYIVNFSIPLIPYAFSGVILAQFNTIMVRGIINSAASGLYSFGYTIGALLLIVINATQTALIPDFFKFLNDKEYGKLDRLVEKVFLVILVAALGLIFFAKEIFIILADKKFHSGLVVVPVIVIGYVFFAMFTVYGRYIGYAKKTLFSSAVVLAAGVLNIMLNAKFIPVYGYIAAAWSTVFSYFIMFLLSWIVSKFILKQQITPLWIIWKPTLLMFCFVIFIYFLNNLGWNAFLFFTLKTVMLIFFTGIVFYKEIKMILNSFFVQPI